MLYSNLHTRSTFSPGVAIGTPSDIIKRAKEIGLHSIAITDRCTMSGALSFFREGQRQKFPVVLGTEVSYYDSLENSKRYMSLVLLAKNQTGYNNLCRLTSLSNEDSRRDELPRLCVEDIRDHREGLFCLTSNMQGPLSAAYFDNKNEWIDLGIERIKTLQGIFNDDLYLELTLNNEQYQNFQTKYREFEFKRVDDYNPLQVVNRTILALSESLGIKAVVSSDAYMPSKDDKVLQDIMIANGNYMGKMHEPRWIMSSQEIEEKVRNEFPFISETRLDEMFDNTVSAASKGVGFSPSFKSQVIDYPVLLHPLGRPGHSKAELVLRIVQQNGRVDLGSPIYRDRLQYELNAVCNNGKINLIDYFLVLEDLCRWCRSNGIVVGPGRGSGAGALLNYCLGITHLDPIKYNLLFERFISKGRIQKGTLPDVDLDFSDQDAVKAYLVDEYGHERVKPIGTSQTLHIRNAIKDTFKALYPEVPFVQVNSITSKISKPEPEEREVDLFNRSISESKELKDMMDRFPKVKNSVEKLIGFCRQFSAHPCGLAISQDPLAEFAPLRFIKDKWVLEYNADDAAFSGIIKYDILSLTTLKYWKTCLELIKERTGKEIDVYSLPLDDRPTYEAFERGDTESVFQFNSEVAINILRKIKLSSIDDLSMVTSVGRPGPMMNSQHLEFIRRKNGEVDPIPPHYALEGLLKDTYGIMIYQESVMKAAQILGGFTLAEADDIRKAMGKKNVEYIKPYKERFVEHASKNFADISTGRAEEIFHLMETFSGYGFNRSHAISYTLIGYICQYFKIHYPLEWWTACLTHAVSEDHVTKYYGAAKQYVRLPDINKSKDKYYITDDGFIQMPFGVVKGVGDAAANEIASKRPFLSFRDFFDRVNRTKCNKRVVLSLVFAGAFDELCGVDKSKVAEAYFVLRKEKVPPELQNIDKVAMSRLVNDALEFMVPDYYQIYDDLFQDKPKLSFRDMDRKNLEHKAKHSLEDDFRKMGRCPMDWFPAKITEVKHNTTSTKKPWWRLVLMNQGQSMKVKMWDSEIKTYGGLVKEGAVLIFRTVGTFYYEEPQLQVVSIMTPDGYKNIGKVKP